ncbi:flippase [candidate division KSB1 bacterium]
MIKNNEKLGESIVKNSSLFFFGTVLDKLFSFLAIVLITRYLSEEGFGIFNYALVYISLFAGIIGLGTESILVREISKYPEKSEILIGNNILLKLFLSLLTIILSFGICTLMNLRYDKTLLIYIMLINLILSPKLPTLKTSFEAAFKVRLKIGFPVLMNILGSVVLLITVIIIIHLKGSINLITLGYVLSGFPGLVLLILKSKKTIAPKFTVDLKLWKYFLKESFPLAICGILINFSNRIDVLMLSWIKGDIEVGYYSAAFRLIFPLSFIPVALVTSLLPVISKLYYEKDKSINRIYQFSLKIMFGLSLPMAVIVFFTSGEIIDLIYTSRYYPSIAGLKILIISQIFLFMNVVMNHFIISIGKQIKALYVVCTMLIINITLNIFLIPEYGLTGASIATVITEFSALILWINFTKEHLRYFHSLSFYKIIIINFTSFVYIYLTINKYFFLGISGFLFIQFLLLYIFKVFTKKELSEFKISVS